MQIQVAVKAYLGVAILVVICGQLVSAEPAEDRPNVVVILTDDQGYGDLGIHGNQNLSTPHIDQFARDGIQLTRFYCSPVCAPTRASLLTGRYYYRTGVLHTSRGGAKMAGSERTLAELLRDNGYVTGIFGKWHLGDNYPMRPQDQGFTETLIHKSGGIGQTPDKPTAIPRPGCGKMASAFEPLAIARTSSSPPRCSSSNAISESRSSSTCRPTRRIRL